jgi:hypothetical protein
MDESTKKYLVKKFASAINHESVDSDLETPDFVLANFLVGSLELLEKAGEQVDSFYGVDDNDGE